MNKEVHYEGWLIKSPPTKRIWRARWRRRWFTLKQGEIPEQFCLEYYTDRNCRKLKGVIDLDQCEQVDCGLRLENRKQKFQFMFDIKTPRRTYYLAADTAADMRDWVNCICQVCHLHDTKQSNEIQENAVSPNSSTILQYHHKLSVSTSATQQLQSLTATSSTNDSKIASTNSIEIGVIANTSSIKQQSSLNVDCLRKNADHLKQQEQSTLGTYQNNDCSYVNTEYTNRDTMICDTRFDHNQAMYHNSPAAAFASQLESARLAVNSNGVVRKIPENLVLNSMPLPESQTHNVEPSPALSTSSGPYIPISECFSGSPKFVIDGKNPSTPLNNLDPRFYDTPRSHNNIGLNLTNDQSYSPKITNCGLHQHTPTAKVRSGRSSPTDSESVFTDDDEWTHPLPLRENADRNSRPSDSSVENESFVFTYSQRFSKLPDDGKERPPDQKNEHEKLANVLTRKKKLILDIKENEKATRELPQLSDTENTSPAIGPHNASSCVDESYDIPRSHYLPYYNMSNLFDKVGSPESNPIAASTPNLVGCTEADVGSTLIQVQTLPRPHCYTNAAPTKVEGNVFRYDFIEQSDLPPVNRNLKPKLSLEDKPPDELPAKPPTHGSPHTVDSLSAKLTAATLHTGLTKSFGVENCSPRPPSIDRKLKPNAYKFTSTDTVGTTSRRSGIPLSVVLPNKEDSYKLETRTLPRHPRTNFAISGYGASSAGGYRSTVNRATSMSNAKLTAGTSYIPTPTLTAARNEHKLQYFDLDVANPPTINRQSISVGNLMASGPNRLGIPADPSARAPVKSSVVYNSVDFLKTEAFKRIREERTKENEGINK